MKVIIFTNGEYHDPEFYRRKLEENPQATVIVADGGQILSGNLIFVQTIC